MSTLRFLAVVVIFGAVSLAWVVLGASIGSRTRTLDQRLSQEMDSLLGPGVLAQPAPYLAAGKDIGRDDPSVTAPSSSTVAADVKHHYRYKGLLWYTALSLAFEGRYTVPARPGGAAATAAAESFFIFPLPQGVTAYDKLSVTLDESAWEVSSGAIAAGRCVVPVDRAAEHVVTVSYLTTGRDIWLYAPGGAPQALPRDGEQVISASGPLSELRDFSLTVTTDFRDIDYPKGTRSPSEPARPAAAGMAAVWEYANARTNQAMGVVVPARTNAGPIVARMSLFAPVSLFFFFCVLFTVVVLKKIPLHPMHYLFVAAGFFAFHILMAYLVDVLNIHASFWVSAAVSVLLVVSYMRLVAGMKFATAYVGLAQLIYLIGFSYAFFWVGRTGLTVTVGAVLTLFVLMQATGRVDWPEAFSRRPAPPAPPRPGGANGASGGS